MTWNNILRTSESGWTILVRLLVGLVVFLPEGIQKLIRPCWRDGTATASDAQARREVIPQESGPCDNSMPAARFLHWMDRFILIEYPILPALRRLSRSFLTVV